MIKEVYFRARDLDGTLITQSYQGIVLGEEKVLIFTEEGLEVRRFRKSGEFDITESLFFAHLFLIGDPDKTIDVKAVQNMSVVEFFNYLASLKGKRKPVLKCLSR